MPQPIFAQGIAVRSLVKKFLSAAAIAVVAAVPLVGIAQVGFGVLSSADYSNVVAAEKVVSNSLLAFDGPAANANRIKLAEREANGNLPTRGFSGEESAVVLTNSSLTATKVNASPISR